MKTALGSFLAAMIVFASALAGSDFNVILLETRLPAPQPSPLQRLDLIPDSSHEIRVRVFPIVALLANPVSPSQDFTAPRIRVADAGDILFNASLVSLVALNAADYISTLEALKYPGVEEKNPVLKSVVKDPCAFAAVKIGFTALTCCSLKSLYKKSKPLAWAVSVASNFAFSYIVSNNMRIISRCKAR